MLEQLEAARARARMLEDQAEATAQEAVEAKAQIVAAANAAIDEIIRASGLTYGDLLSVPGPEIEKMLMTFRGRSEQPDKPARKRSNAGDHPRYALIGDPNCTYSRGPLPLWLKMSMGEAGFDHTKAVDRLAFREQNMVRVQA